MLFWRTGPCWRFGFVCIECAPGAAAGSSRVMVIAIKSRIFPVISCLMCARRRCLALSAFVCGMCDYKGLYQAYVDGLDTCEQLQQYRDESTVVLTLCKNDFLVYAQQFKRLTARAISLLFGTRITHVTCKQVELHRKNVFDHVGGHSASPLSCHNSRGGRRAPHLCAHAAIHMLCPVHSAFGQQFVFKGSVFVFMHHGGCHWSMVD
jgi:hypothetical protein